MLPAYDYPDAASLLAADVVRLEEQLTIALEDLNIYRDMLFVALRVLTSAFCRMARFQQ